MPEIRTWQTKHDEVDSRIGGDCKMSNISDSVDQFPVGLTGEGEHFEATADTLDGEEKQAGEGQGRCCLQEMYGIAVNAVLGSASNMI